MSSTLESSFEDLEDLDGHELQEMFGGLEREIRSLDSQKRELREERGDLVSQVKILRGAVGLIEGANSERRELLRKFHEVRKAADKSRSKRDRVNALIPPPVDVLNEWLSETYRRLTTIDNDLTAVPTLPRELDAFRRFFEIQASIVVKAESEKAHSEYVASVKKMKDITSKLDQGKEERKSVTSKAIDESGIGTEGISRSDVRKVSNRISNIDKKLEKIESERRGLRKELGRVKAYRRITGSRNRKVRFSEIKDKAKTGGTLSTIELDALLGSGSLSDLASSDSEPPVEEKEKAPTGNRRRRLGVSRRGPRKGNLASKRED
ncbi:MAG: hypothetical protein CMB53_02570 [Euryarchaeota archaeon]|nr:hypothetical protein [Euryarchaeota archaeon]|tara:strand:+ start:44220 stop:45185 length:966 start_codon:yes stop_codon:yes gene_type:complete